MHIILDLGVERVFAHTLTVNTASRRVLEKCGLTLVRTIPYERADVIEGAERGEVEYALTKPAFYAARLTEASTSPAISELSSQRQSRSARLGRWS